MHGIKLAGLDLDRKILSDIAIREPEAFAAIVTTARSALGYGTDRSGGLNPTPI
jgi:large subunit ribosomal protein L20